MVLHPSSIYVLLQLYLPFFSNQFFQMQILVIHFTTALSLIVIKCQFYGFLSNSHHFMIFHDIEMSVRDFRSRLQESSAMKIGQEISHAHLEQFYFIIHYHLRSEKCLKTLSVLTHTVTCWDEILSTGCIWFGSKD